MARTGKPAANAVRVEIVEFAGDARSEARARGLAGEIHSRLQGYGSAAYVGDRGDPNQSFYGYHAPLQNFAGFGDTGGLGANPNVYAARSAQLSDGAVDEPYADPAKRILAERMRRRR